MSYEREYEDISFKYSLPSKKFHPSYVLEKYVREIAFQRGISPEKVIDSYVEIYLNDLNKNVTKMIYHDGNRIFKSINNECIIDDVLDEDEIIKEIIENF